MSQRLPASRLASHSPPPPQKIVLPPVLLRDDSQYGGRAGERQMPESEGAALQSSGQFPRTGQTTPSGEGWRPAPLRDHGVHTMLNPSEPETSGAVDRRLRGAASESPSLNAARASPQFGVSPTTAPSHTFSSQAPPHDGSSTSELSGGTLPRARKILTPRSPSRSFSATRGAGGQFIDASRSPFLSGRPRTFTSDLQSYEPSSMTTPPMTTGQPHTHHGFPPSSSTPLAARRASAGTVQPPGQVAPSQTASPSISASSHNPSSSQTSPASFPYQRGPQAPPTTTPYFPGSSFSSIIQQGGGLQFHGEPVAPEGPYSSQALSQAQGGASLHSTSIASSRQTSASDNIQVLTITTSDGEYTVPVDVHQASKLADEKRKRNAGASARFRQRRKDKEKEATTNIDKLNQQNRDLERRVREVEHERDWYRAERDRLRDIFDRTPETRHHIVQAPPSPRTMHSVPFQASHGGPASSSMGFPAGPTSPQERAPRRRRTDVRGDFASVPYSGPPTTAGLPPVQPALAFPRPPAASLPPLRIESTPAPRVGGPTLGTPSSEAPQPQYPPFSRSPYERSWPAGDGPRR